MAKYLFPKGEKHPMYGKKMSEDVKEKMRKAIKERWDLGLQKPIDEKFLGENHHTSKEVIAIVNIAGRWETLKYGCIKDMSNDIHSKFGFSKRGLESNWRNRVPDKHLDDIKFVGTIEEYKIKLGA